MFRAITTRLVVLALLQIGLTARAESLSTSKIKTDSAVIPDRKWSGEWQFEIAGEQLNHGKDEGTAAAFFLKTNFEYRFAPWLKAIAKPRLDFYSSRLQERYESDDYKSRIRLTEFVLSVNPIEQVELHAGAPSLEYLNSPMLISKRRTWPGVKAIVGQELSNHDHSVKGQFVVQHSIPTSYSLNVDRQDKEQLPTFDTQSIHLSGKHLDLVEWKAYGGHFNYSNLPSKVAYESRFGGNSVIGDEPASARFVSGYDGFFGGFEICGCASALWVQPVFEFQRITNQRAGAGLGNGEMWGVGPRMIFGDTVLDLRYRRFFIEKDATVAAYMTSFIGNTNRMGDDVEFKLNFRDKKFAIVGEWANAVPIRDNLIQQTVTSIYLGVETHYAPF